MEEVTSELVTEKKSSASIPLIHRDISWLQFNLRVLEEAEDSSNPLLERVKFLAISASNLDEFHMVRVSSLERGLDTLERKKDTAARDYLLGVRSEIYQAVGRFSALQLKVLEDICAQLKKVGIEIIQDVAQISELPEARKIFEKEVLPHLPQTQSFSADKLSELGNLEIAAIFPGDLWVRLPKTLPSMFLSCDSGNKSDRVKFFFLDHLVQAFLLPHPTSTGEICFARITRHADDSIDLTNSDPDFIPDAILREINKREKGGPLRLEITGKVPAQLPTQAGQSLKLTPEQIFSRNFTLCLHGLWTVVHKTPREIAHANNLTLPPVKAYVPKNFRNQAQIFSGLKEKDYLLHHPYDSFDSYVSLVEAATKDPQVVSIEQTVYRMDAVSKVMALLKEAAKTKDVRVIIELRARFDELNNLHFAEELRKAGVQVFFGFGNLKLHAKMALISRQEESGLVRYTHLSTGNYNAATARQYTDMSLVTANADIGHDARNFFDFLYKKEVPHTFKRLVIAPQFLARRMLSHIKEETEAALAGKPARIFAKVNALVDEKVIEALYQASQAGVHIDLVVRGACSLVPELKEISERIHVTSIVDRFLEHSRMYYFESSKKLYLSSADWMPRNFFSRLEIAFPILDPRVYAYLTEFVIPAYLNDTKKARRLTSLGEWRRRSREEPTPAPLRAQEVFEKVAAEGYKNTILAT